MFISIFPLGFREVLHGGRSRGFLPTFIRVSTELFERPSSIMLLHRLRDEEIVYILIIFQNETVTN